MKSRENVSGLKKNPTEKVLRGTIGGKKTVYFLFLNLRKCPYGHKKFPGGNSLLPADAACEGPCVLKTLEAKKVGGLPKRSLPPI